VAIINATSESLLEPDRECFDSLCQAELRVIPYHSNLENLLVETFAKRKENDSNIWLIGLSTFDDEVKKYYWKFYYKFNSKGFF